MRLTITLLIAKSNDGASKLDLLGKFNVSTTFNVPNFFPFDVGDNLRTYLSEEEGNNGDHSSRDPVDRARRIQVGDMG